MAADRSLRAREEACVEDLHQMQGRCFGTRLVVLAAHPAPGGIGVVPAGHRDRVHAAAVLDLAQRVAEQGAVAVSKVRASLDGDCLRSEEHTSELQSLMRISYAVFCLKKKTKRKCIQKAERET